MYTFELWCKQNDVNKTLEEALRNSLQATYGKVPTGEIEWNNELRVVLNKQRTMLAIAGPGRVAVG